MGKSEAQNEKCLCTRVREQYQPFSHSFTEYNQYVLRASPVPWDILHCTKETGPLSHRAYVPVEMSGGERPQTAGGVVTGGGEYCSTKKKREKNRAEEEVGWAAVLNRVGLTER